MNKIAFIFPGQASQYVGMASDLYSGSERVRDLYARASEILEFDLAAMCFEGPMEQLTRTEHTQPAVLVHSLSVLELLKDQKLEPDYCAGHSLGEYSGLACAGTLTYENAITAVRERSRLMKQACDATDGTMTAAIGGTEEGLASLINDAQDIGVLQAANFNSPGQIALSGERSAVEFAQEHYKDYGFRRMLPLKVGGAFHSPLMQGAAEQMSGALANMDFGPPNCPVVANVSAEPVTDHELHRKLLVEQITSPVRWMQSVEKMYELGVRSFIEIGPGKVLTGLVSKTLKDVEVLNVDKMSDIEQFATKVK
jgi:[acyl-carrier-protein] S-malonyltransferase